MLFKAKNVFAALFIAAALPISGCANVDVPDSRNVKIPPPQQAQERRMAVNERPDAVMYLPLGSDVLLPEAGDEEHLPPAIVGPFELRGETLAGALQLILDGHDIPLAFETEEGLTRRVTVANLKGELGQVVSRVCSLADLYCSFEDGMLVIKDSQVFTVSIPPLAEADTFLTDVSAALAEILGTSPITDASTRTIVYRASARTAEMAERYFQRLRSNTALIVFETYIWEVTLNNGNSTGIDWQQIDEFGKFNFGVDLQGAASALVGSPISIGLPTTGDVAFDGNDVFQFISSYGAVKTISQPQITVLSGSEARLRVADTQNYVASITRTADQIGASVSTTTDSVDTGFTLEIASSWDKSTIYGTISIDLEQVTAIDTFDDNPDAIVQLPQTTIRELETQVRVRPGDSLLIAGLVREADNFNDEGPGLMAPFIPTSRTARIQNQELVFLMRPRVVVYVDKPVGELKKDIKDAAKLVQTTSSSDALEMIDAPASSSVLADSDALPEEQAPALVKVEQETVKQVTVDTLPPQEEKMAKVAANQTPPAVIEDEVVVVESPAVVQAEPMKPPIPARAPKRQAPPSPSQESSAVQAPVTGAEQRADAEPKGSEPVIVETVEREVVAVQPVDDVPVVRAGNAAQAMEAEERNVIVSSSQALVEPQPLQDEVKAVKVVTRQEKQTVVVPSDAPLTSGMVVERKMGDSLSQTSSVLPDYATNSPNFNRDRLTQPVAVRVEAEPLLDEEYMPLIIEDSSDAEKQ
ncbi:MAG: type II and III secretion system family protein [Micavibrio sp.]|nr:type II and III secretion system family protein [Micavibrio sp.]